MPRRCARAVSLRPSTPIRGRRGYTRITSVKPTPHMGAASMRSSFLTPRWREMDSNHRSPVKDQLVDTFYSTSSGGSEAHHRRSANLNRAIWAAISAGTITSATTTTAWLGRTQAQNGGSPDGGPMVRILLPPGKSPVRTSSNQLRNQISADNPSAGSSVYRIVSLCEGEGC